jgi:hypothetical protein
MASRYVSALGYLVDRAASAQEAFHTLNTAGYLSELATARPEAVVELIQKVHDDWPETPAPGAEPWRKVQSEQLAGRAISVPRRLSRRSSAGAKADPPDCSFCFSIAL